MILETHFLKFLQCECIEDRICEANTGLSALQCLGTYLPRMEHVLVGTSTIQLGRCAPVQKTRSLLIRVPSV